MKIVVSVIFCFFFIFNTNGQEKFYFSNLNVRDGLSQSSITAIFQDREGYLWFGTSNGLNRFDGYGFKIYKKKENTSGNSLSHNEINQIRQDSAGNLWILAGPGIDRIDYHTDEITHYLPTGKKFKNILCKQGSVLAFTSDLIYRYESSRDSFVTIPLAFSFPSPISTVTADSAGNLYLGTDKDGIFICDSAFRLTRQLTSDGISSDVVRDLLIDKEDHLWIVFNKKGIERYHLPSDSLSRPVYANYNIIGHHIRTAIDWNSEQLLLGTFNGLALLNKKDLSMTPIQSNLGERGGLSHYSVYHLFKDKQETLWVGTYSGGVNYHNRYNNRFELITPKIYSGVIRKGEEDKNGILWFATEGRGILSYNPATGEQKNYLLPTSNTIYYNNLIKTLLITGDSILCTVFGGKVYSFSPRTEKFRLLYDFHYNDIYSLCLDSRGKLWIPTNTSSGLVVAEKNKLTDKFQVGDKLQKFQSVTVIAELSGYRFLIGTLNRGFYLYAPENGSLTHFSNHELGIPEGETISVSAFYIDSQQNIWVSTNGQGLWCFDSRMQLKKQYTSADGLTDPEVYYVAEDKEGLFWAMTCHELYRLHPEKGIVNRFNSKNGIELQEFSIFSGIMTRSGKLYLSGMNAFQCINPQELRRNTEAPAVSLTGLFVNNKEITPQTPHSPLQKKLQHTKHLVLNHNQTNFSIGYTALNYIYPGQNQYAYKLEGADSDWNYVKNRREAYYSNLKPGNYLFRVIASNNDGVWNDKGTSLEITVLPPYWLRWWAYLVYTSIFLFILWKFVAWRNKKQEFENRLRFKQLEQEKQEEMNRERNRFFTHVTHEFRTPLTLILNPTEELLENDGQNPENRNLLILIRKNAQRLLSLVNNLMDIQKHHSGKKNLQLSSFDFTEFIQEIYYNFQATAPGRELTFHLDFPIETLPVTYDREELEKVFFNLLSNAFKFTPAGGHVEICGHLVNMGNQADLPESGKVDFSAHPQWLFMAVRDSGIGISETDCDKMFEPFYHSSNDLHQKTAGSGVGLSLSRTIVEKHGGKIYARPLQPGTEMGVILPLNYDPSVPQTQNDLLPGEQETSITEQEPRPDITILLVEDNPEILSYVSRRLKDSYHIITAVNGRDALAAAEKHLPDIVISDIMMPVMNGVELCNKIKSTLALSHIPVILLTAKSMAMHMEEGFNAGADDYIVKPFSLPLLKVRIRNLLANRQRMKEIYYKRFSIENTGIKIESIDDMFMDKYMETVRRHISEPDFEIDDICREMGLSRANFYRKIKLITTLSPMEMIRNIRLENAVRLLKESHLSVSEIAFKVGFNNHSYFTSCFKALYGISPTDFQEKERKNE